jgi:DNA repair protein RadC
MTYTEWEEDVIIQNAKDILSKRLTQPLTFIKNIEAVNTLLQIEYGQLEVEQFGCMFLNSQYALINHQKLFRGTIQQCSTYPREIVREALLQNAVFVVLVHNHPSGHVAPSAADILVTDTLKDMLRLLDIVLFDHIIVAGLNILSMRQEGLLS